MPLLIRGGRVIDPTQGLDAYLDILVDDGRIVSLDKGSPSPRVEPTEGTEELDVSGRIVTPGLIDLHTHLREPGFEYKETIHSGTAAAAAGGFTSIACMANTQPVNDNRSVTEFILRQARREGLVHVYPVGALSKGLKGEELSEMGELQEAGVVAVSDDGRPVMNAEVMRRALEYARTFDLLVISHCEDLNLAAGGVMHEGYVSTELGLQGIPRAAEEVMVAREIALVELTGARLHVAHVSTAGSVRLIREAKARGLPITCEVTPHHLTLTDEAVRGYDTNTKMNPPLRIQADVEALREGLRDGTIDAIATDHAPHHPSEKEVEYDLAPFGVIGLETALPLALRLVHEGALTLPQLIAAFTTNPARIIGVNRGRLAVGDEADLTIIDLDRKFLVDPARLRSQSRNTPFAAWLLQGCADKTMVGGQVVFCREEKE